MELHEVQFTTLKFHVCILFGKERVKEKDNLPMLNIWLAPNVALAKWKSTYKIVFPFGCQIWHLPNMELTLFGAHKIGLA